MRIKLIRDDLDEQVEIEVEFGDEPTVSDLLDSEGIESQEVLVSRNDTIISGKHVLEDGDVVRVFDVIAGG